MVKERILCSVFLFLIFDSTLTSCVSIGVSMRGKDYFVGKDETALIKYFGDAVASDEGEGEYDRIVYYTNVKGEFVATKTITQRYKVSNSHDILI